VLRDEILFDIEGVSEALAPGVKAEERRVDQGAAEGGLREWLFLYQDGHEFAVNANGRCDVIAHEANK
jgi:hypothetical protein